MVDSQDYKEVGLLAEIWGKSAIATTGEFQLMFTNTEVHKIVRISKTNQDNPNL